MENSTSEISKEDKNWAVLIHLSPLLGYISGGLGFLVPFLLWIFKRNESSYIDSQGKEVMNFLITLIIISAVILPLCILLIGFPLYVVLVISALILTIMAAIQTSEGKSYRYPYILRLIK